MVSLNVSDTPRRVAIYIRVSTAEQKIDGYGLEAQQKKLQDHVKNNQALNLTTKPEWLFSDAHTGSDLNRPQLQKLLEGVRLKKYDAVLVWKIDRLSRNLKHLLTVFEELEKHEVSFISMQENIDFKGPIGKLIFQIFGAIAQFERELIKGRTQMGRIASADLGNYTGTNIPYGYEPIPNAGGKGKKLRTLPNEKKWIQQIFNWYIFETDCGYGQIASKLNASKVPKGKYSKEKDKFSPWTAKIIEKSIQNQIYRGEFAANKKDEAGNMLPEHEWTVVAIPPCVSEFTFQQAQNVRINRVGGRKNSIYLLSGKMVDMTLDKPKAFSGAKRFKGGYSYRRKQFNDKSGEHHPVFEIPAKQIEDYVWGKIMAAMHNPEVFVKHYLSQQYVAAGKIDQLEQQLTNLRERRINIETVEMSRIEAAYENGMYSDEKTQQKLSVKNEELGDIEDKIQKIEDELQFAGSVSKEVESLKEAAEEVRYRLDNLKPDQKKIVCDLFVDRIEMRREKQGARWKIRAEIYFRFNPKKLADTANRDRTETGLTKATRGTLKKKSDNYGGSGGT